MCKLRGTSGPVFGGCRHRRRRRRYGHGRMGIPTAGKATKKTKQKQSSRVSGFVCVRAYVGRLRESKDGAIQKVKIVQLT
jgi:hypothetical protein